MVSDYVPDTCLARGNRGKSRAQSRCNGRPAKPVTTVGVIGLGDIGRGVAEAVVRAGFALVRL